MLDFDAVAAAVRAGSTPRHWADNARKVDAYDAKADALAVLAATGAPMTSVQVFAEAPAWYHPGRSGSLRLGPVLLGYFGELHPAVLEAAVIAVPHPRWASLGR